MNDMLKALVQRAGITSLALLVTGAQLVPAGAQGPRTAYQATYDFYSPQGNSQHTMWSDGRGHVRSEQTINGMKYVSIMDFPNKVMYSISDAQRTVTKMPLNTSNVADDEYLKKMKAQKLPPKMVDGHLCNGWRYTMQGHVTELWDGTDTGCAVLQTQDGKTAQKLKAYQRMNPPATYFSVPAGYKVMDMSSILQQAQQYNQGGSYGQGAPQMPDMSKFKNYSAPASSSYEE